VEEEFNVTGGGGRIKEKTTISAIEVKGRIREIAEGESDPNS